MELRDIIKTRRSALNLTLEDIAKKVGVSKATVQRWESGNITNIRRDKIAKLARTLEINPLILVSADKKISEFSPATAMIPIYGSIPAGLPALAEQNIEGWLPTDKPNASEYFYLRVSGTSMINAGIVDGCKVLVHRQSYADDGQIVACRLNGNEATLKRFKQQGDMILLFPENPEYEPRIVPAAAFASGEAEIIGVVKEIVISV